VTTEPVVLHFVRPYANVEDYLAAEAWTLDARSMLLVGETGVAPDTAIVFDVTLGDGARPIKAEARVIGPVEARDGKPGGLRVRFRRYGAPTKAFIERAMAFAATGVDSGPPPPPPGPPEPSSPGLSVPDASAPLHAAPVAEAALAAGNLQPTISYASVVRASDGARAAEPRGALDSPTLLAALRRRGAQMPETPSNREYLLEKLRQRSAPEDVTMRYQRD
jgi:hypothetical protein